MDRMVAEKVMGDDIAIKKEHQWRLDEDGKVDEFGTEYENHNGPYCERCDYSYCVHCGDKPSAKCAPFVKPYSTDIGYAWKVWERLYKTVSSLSLVQAGSTLELSLTIPDKLDCTRSRRVVATADTAPLAICRAALKAFHD